MSILRVEAATQSVLTPGYIWSGNTPVTPNAGGGRDTWIGFAVGDDMDIFIAGSKWTEAGEFDTVGKYGSE